MAQVIGQGDASGVDPYVECLFRRIELAREIGRPTRVAELIEGLERRLGPMVSGANSERLDAARDWLGWAMDYEATNGPESLLNRSHPIHRWALAEVARLDEKARRLGRSPDWRRVR